MTLARTIAWDDMILPFQLDRADARGRLARLDSTLTQILAQHDYPEAVARLVAEAAILTALIGQSVKLRWRLSLQLRGDGPVHLIATDYFAPEQEGERARIRAYAGFSPEAARLPADAGIAAFRGGVFGITIDQGPGNRPYQGIAPLTGGSLAESAAVYFAQSEQLPTRFAIAARCEPAAGEGGVAVWRGAGIMLQHLPKGSPTAQSGGSGEGGLLTATDLLRGDDAENWNRINYLLDTVTEDELVGPEVGATDLLVRLFHEEAPRVFDAQPVSFGCTCSEAKVRDAIAAHSPQERAEMVTPEGTITADCQFCGAHYVIDPEALEAEIRNARRS